MAGEEKKAEDEKKTEKDNAQTPQPPAAAGLTAATATATDGEDSPVDASLPGGARGSDSERMRGVWTVVARSPPQLPPTGGRNLDDRAVRELASSPVGSDTMNVPVVFPPRPPFPPTGRGTLDDSAIREIMGSTALTNFRVRLRPWPQLYPPERSGRNFMAEQASPSRYRPPLPDGINSTHVRTALLSAAAVGYNPGSWRASLRAAAARVSATGSWNFGPPQPHHFQSQQHYEQFMSRHRHAPTGWPRGAVPVFLPLQGLLSSGPLRQGHFVVPFFQTTRQTATASNQNASLGQTGQQHDDALRNQQVGGGQRSDAEAVAAAAEARQANVKRPMLSQQQADVKRRKLTQQQEKLHLGPPPWAARSITANLQEILRGIKIPSTWQPPVPVDSFLRPQPQQGVARGDQQVRQGSGSHTSAAEAKEALRASMMRRMHNRQQEMLHLDQPSTAAQANTAALQENIRFRQPSSAAAPLVPADLPSSAAQEKLRLEQANTAPLQEKLRLSKAATSAAQANMATFQEMLRLDQPSSVAQGTALQENLRFRQPLSSSGRPPVLADQPAAAAPRTLQLLDPKPPNCLVCKAMPMCQRGLPGSTMHLCVCEGCFNAGITRCSSCCSGLDIDQPSSAAQATAFQETFGLSPATTAALREMIREETAAVFQDKFGLPRVGQPSSSAPRSLVPAGQHAAAAPRILELLDPKPPVPIFTPPKCLACNNRPASTVPSPTVHLCLCEDCFNAGSTACPICRGDRTPRG